MSAPRTRRVAVVGGGFGGMTAAALLAKDGYDVTLFEAQPALGGKAQVVTADGLRLDTGPTLLTLPHVVRAAFERLGALDLLPAFDALGLQCAYQWPDGCRFQAHADLERTAASAADIRPREARGVRSFYAEAAELYAAAGEPYLEAPFDNMPAFMARVARRGVGAVAKGMAMGTLQQLADAHFATDHLRDFVGRFATYAGANPWETSAAFAMIPHIERAFGVHHVRGGMGALVAALEAAARRLGVTVRAGVKARWFREGNAFRVGPAREEELYDAVVVNDDPLAHVGRGDEPLALSGYVLLLRSRVRSQLPHHAVAFGGDYAREFRELFSHQLAGDPTVYACHPAATDASMAPAGQSGLFVMVNAPALQGDHPVDWAEAAPRVREQALQKLFQMDPSLRGQVEVLGERTPQDLKQRALAPGGSIYGFLPHGKFGPFRRPALKGDSPGLVYAGGGTHPGGGVPMVMMSGSFAAGLVQAHLGGRP